MDTITQLLLLLLVGVTVPGSAQESNDGAPFVYEGDWTLDLKLILEDLTQIKETQKTIQADLKNVQERVINIEETQKTIQADLKRLQQCSTKEQVLDFQEQVFKDDCEEGKMVCSNMSTCTDYFNRYECSCHPGYSGDGFTCQDVDECSETDICSHNEICHNTPGSYRCVCPLGFKKEGDICQDVDECSGNGDICGDHGTCQNNACICDKYFKKVGNICQGPVCESSRTSLFLPELGCLTAVRESMTWDEAKSRCQDLGKRLAIGLKKRDIQTLNEHFGRWGDLWVGLKDGQWIHEEGEEEEEEVSSADWVTGYPRGERNQCGAVFIDGLADFPCSSTSYALCQFLP